MSMLCALPMRPRTASSLDQRIRCLEARGRPHYLTGAVSACAARCGTRRNPSFDRTGSSTISKPRWMRQQSRGRSLPIPRWRFREGVRSPSISKEMWITDCGSYDFPLHLLAFGTEAVSSALSAGAASWPNAPLHSRSTQPGGSVRRSERSQTDRMAEPLKTFFSPALVRRLAGDIERVHPSFPSRAFIGDATKGLDELELLDRGKHITRALEKHLPASYPDAIDILL